MGINVLGPDVNESYSRFSADKQGNVRFGLAAIKGVGKAAVDSIVEERRKNGRFKDIYDFMERVDFSYVNSKSIENMALAGAFDSLIDFHRSKLTASDLRDHNNVTMLEQLVRYGVKFQMDRQSSQQSLFGDGGLKVEIARPQVPICQEGSKIEMLKKEREVVGVYLSSHPLDDYSFIIDKMCTAKLSDLSNVAASQPREVTFVGMVVSAKHLISQNGRPYGRFELEDYSASHEFSLYGKDYENMRKYMFEDYMLLVKAKIQPRRFQSKENTARGRVEMELVITSMMQLGEVLDNIKEIQISIPLYALTDELVTRFSEQARSAKGNARLRVKVVDEHNDVSLAFHSKTLKIMPKNLITFCEDNDLNYLIS